MRAARSVNTQAWIRNVNSKRQAHKGNANHVARKERAAELMKMRRDGNTSGLKNATDNIRANTHEEIDALIANYLNK